MVECRFSSWRCKVAKRDKAAALIQETLYVMNETFVISLKLRQLRASSYVNLATSSMKSASNANYSEYSEKHPYVTLLLVTKFKPR